MVSIDIATIALSSATRTMNSGPGLRKTQVT
jgi:hypothetical protein